MNELLRLLPAVGLALAPLHLPRQDSLMVQVCGSDTVVEIPLDGDRTPKPARRDCTMACHAANGERRGKGKTA
ncbi:MAG: hypothetical protein CVT77_10060 [Alphaproteobacteria bacterium HGW-Alphaproteobacteria-16]|nr:MAG: hypothetical protein CVT77_10060 [Alphaproteobacteria bacterium HGW-Alphaproteobacteria-16]